MVRRVVVVVVVVVIAADVNSVSGQFKSGNGNDDVDQAHALSTAWRKRC